MQAGRRVFLISREGAKKNGRMLPFSSLRGFAPSRENFGLGIEKPHLPLISRIQQFSFS